MLLCLFLSLVFPVALLSLLVSLFPVLLFPTRFSRFLTAFRTFLPCATCWCCFLNTICHCRATFTRDCFRNGCYAKKALITKELHKPMVAKRCQLILFMSSFFLCTIPAKPMKAKLGMLNFLPLVPSYRGARVSRDSLC